MLSHRILPLALVASLVPLASATACNIPVFRYALERWRAERAEDLYTVVIFHRGPLSPEHKAAVETLQKLGDDRTPKANFTVELVDVAGKMRPDQQELWHAQKDPPLPLLVVRYPDSQDKTPTPWAAPLNEQSVRLLTDSPLRKEIARCILRGDSIVWVLLESGEKDQDEAAAKLLQAELTRLEKVVELPEGLGEGPVKLLSEVPVRIAFSMVRVSRTDAAEQVLVGMLLHSEDDLPQEKGPMAFPVFGRGRFLEGLVGKGINPETLHQACQFLCAACSCRVKRLNPGTDLLMTVEWDVLLDTPPEKEAEQLGIGGQAVPIASGKPEDRGPLAAETASWAGSRVTLLAWAVAGAAGVLVLVMAGVAFALLRRQPNGTGDGQ